MLASALGVVLWSGAAQATVVNFEDLGFTSGNYENGANLAGSGTFTSQGATFNNLYDVDPTYGPWWEGWAYSKNTDTTTPNSVNQYSAITGSGQGASSNYGVAYQGWTTPTITLPNPTTVSGVYFTNTTYAYYGVRDGVYDPMFGWLSKKFGGTTGNDPDWFKLTITGKDLLGNVVGTKDFYLADYRFANSAQDYIVQDWTWVNLTDLGNQVKTLEFGFSSSDNVTYDNGVTYFMNTPAYVAMDNLTIVPEPSALALLAAGAAVFGWCWRRKTHHAK